MSGRVQTTARMVMRAVRVSQFGGPEVLKIDGQCPVPQPTDTQVLVEVKAAGINPVDTYIRTGTYARVPTLPYIPGNDAAGIVKETGTAVTKFKPGDRVYVVKSVSGGYAEYTTAEEDMVGSLDEKLTFQQGAGIGVPCFTAYRALCITAKGNFKPGNSVLIHGASGAVGLACVQIAASRGLTVYGTAGSQEGLDLVKKQGASAVFNHREEGYASQITEATGGKGVDIVIEMLANVNLQTDLNLVARHGIIVIIGNRGLTQIDGRTIMGKQCVITGSSFWDTLCVVGNRGTIEINPRLTMQKECIITGMGTVNATAEEWVEMHLGVGEGLQAGWLQPQVFKEYSLDEAPLAHEEVIASTATLGKRVFVM